jgi:hypothetical protein
MIVFAREDWVFNHRVAAVLLHQASVLLHRAALVSYGGSPGIRQVVALASHDGDGARLVARLHGRWRA